MADSISKITVKIGGMNYQLLAAENEVYMRQVAAHADEMIRRVMQNSPHLTLSMSTVLALVNAVDEQYNARKGQEAAERKSQEAEKRLEEMKSELMRCREQTWEIKKDLLHYQNLCKEYEELLEQETEVEVDNTQQPQPQEFHPFEQTRLDDYLLVPSNEEPAHSEEERD